MIRNLCYNVKCLSASFTELKNFFFTIKCYFKYEQKVKETREQNIRMKKNPNVNFLFYSFAHGGPLC